MAKKLYRNTHEGALSGVCAGLGEYLEIDKTWVRLVFVLSVVFSSVFGLGLLGAIVYVVLWAIIPVKPFVSESRRDESYYDVDYRVKEDVHESPYSFADNWGIEKEEIYPAKPATSLKKPGKDRKVAGLILLTIGLFFLLHQLDIFYWYEVMRYWPVILIISGIAVIYGSFDRADSHQIDDVDQDSEATDSEENTNSEN